MNFQIVRYASYCLIVVLFCSGCQDKQNKLPRNARAITSPGVSIKPPDEFTPYVRGLLTLTVAPGVHVLGLSPSAAFAIETNKGIVLVDTGVDENAQEIRASLLELALNPKNINTILLTHAHYDHVFGANKLRKASGATVCAGEPECETLRNADLDPMFSLFPRTPYSGDPIEVDRELFDGDVLDFGGGVSIEVIGSPGHTLGSMCYLLKKDGQRILFSGDVIASLNFGPATYSVKISPEFRGDAKSYLQTIDRLLEMEAPDLLLVGHPRQQRHMHSIRVTQKEWTELLQPAKDELQTLISRHEQDGADFLDKTAKQIAAGLWHLGIVDGVSVYWIDDGSKTYLVNAPGDDDFSTYLLEQLDGLGLDAKEPDVVLLTSAKPENRSGLPFIHTEPTIVTNLFGVGSLHSASLKNVMDAASFASSVETEIEFIEFTEGMACTWKTDGKTVLLTPNIPRHMAIRWKDRRTGMVQSSLRLELKMQLRTELKSKPFAANYREALEKLRDVKPDIWLPAKPMSGQNANLYDDQWNRIIDENREQVPGG